MIQKAKQITRKVNGKFLSVKKSLKYRLEQFSIQHKYGKLIQPSVSDLFFKHIHYGELLRCDMVVRYLAVENYYNKNDDGFALYEKMQEFRIRGGGYGRKAVAKFKELIASYERNGYDEESYIVLDKNLNLIDGSHRMALALYYGITRITALSIPFGHPVDYSIDWFISAGFTNEEIDRILNKASELRTKYNSTFSCVIWSPAIKCTAGIVRDLGYYGTVESVRKHSYSSISEYYNVVRAVYAIDDIDCWKIEKKIEHMEQYDPELIEVSLRIDHPDFRTKNVSKMPISKKGERIKKTLRSKYQTQIDNYFFDIILHIADNHLQSEYMKRVFEPGIDIKGILNLLDSYQYALIKIDVPYMPDNFPERIPVGKDIDILCGKADLDNIKKRLSEYAQKYTDYEIVIRDAPNRIRLRFELLGKLVFQIDCCSSYEGIPDEFLEYALQNRIYHEKGYYILDSASEAIIRKAAYEHDNRKTYHQQYYLAHKTKESEEVFESLGGGR